MDECERVYAGEPGRRHGKDFRLCAYLCVADVGEPGGVSDGPENHGRVGATAGFLAGFGWVALGLAMIALFERRSWKYIVINGGYMTVSFTVMGLILGAWR